MAFLTQEELEKLNFKRLGENVLISEKASIYNPSNIEIGDDVRIDDFCILSAGKGGIKFGNNIHIAFNVSMIGDGAITLADFSGVSSRSSIYSSNDDYTGEYMTNPTIPSKYTHVTSGKVHIGKHVIIGSGTIILPNLTIGDGAAVGALSLVNRDVEPFAVMVGNPAKFLKHRSKNLLKLEEEFKKNQS